MAAKVMYCPNCGWEGKPKKKHKGKFMMEVVLWLILIIPGLIYSFWRGFNRVSCCPSCGNENLIPAGSPRAMRLKKEGATV